MPEGVSPVCVNLRVSVRWMLTWFPFALGILFWGGFLFACVPLAQFPYSSRLPEVRCGSGLSRSWVGPVLPCPPGAFRHQEPTPWG